MSIELTIEEKTDIINQHMKILAYEEYNVVLNLSQARAVSIPNQENITNLTNQLDNILVQKQVLQTELESLS